MNIFHLTILESVIDPLTKDDSSSVMDHVILYQFSAVLLYGSIVHSAFPGIDEQNPPALNGWSSNGLEKMFIVSGLYHQYTPFTSR